MNTLNHLNRRKFLTSTAALSAFAFAQPASLVAQSNTARPARSKLCAFEKPLHHLGYEDLADFIADVGFDGIEAAVRPGGYVLPEKVEDDLPRLIDALKKRGLEITVMTTGIGGLDSPHAEKTLRTAAKLGVKHYRMNWYRYDLMKPIPPQLEALRPKLKELAALNRELGITAVYQNHSGPSFVGAPLWDIFDLIKDFDPKEISLAYDIRHAKVEGGLSWPIQWNLVQPILGSVFMKDFVWDHARIKSVPLGEGVVDKKIFSMVKESKFNGPISLHIEYLGSNKDRKVLLEAFKRDFATMKTLLA